MPNPVFESMTKVTIFGWKIRVWREEPALKAGPDRDIEQAIIDCCIKSVSITNLLATVGDMERVSAIEVLDPADQGAIYYPDWK